MDFNSTTNQEIKSKFVHIHVKACVTGLVNFILTTGEQIPNAPFCYDDCYNEPYYFDNQGNELTETEREEKLEELWEQLEAVNQRMIEDLDNSEHDEMYHLIQDEISGLENTDGHYNEIYEWWIVSTYLGDKLQGFNESVINDGLNYYWGRQTTGQAILLDHVISKICDEMEILENQKHSWK